MSIATAERDAFGEPLAPIERILCGIVVGIGAVGHAALAAAAALMLYVVLVGL